MLPVDVQEAKLSVVARTTANMAAILAPTVGKFRSCIESSFRNLCSEILVKAPTFRALEIEQHAKRRTQ
jgi:hypothetical protein